MGSGQSCSVLLSMSGAQDSRVRWKVVEHSLFSVLTCCIPEGAYSNHTIAITIGLGDLGRIGGLG